MTTPHHEIASAEGNEVSPPLPLPESGHMLGSSADASPRSNAPTWTPERNARLTELWHAGVSIRDIATEMHSTLQAVQSQARVRLSLPRRAAGKMDWSAESLAELRRRWEAGETATVIAAALETTRNSVIAKARRLGLDGRPSPIIRIARPTGNAVTLLELTERTCRFPLGEFHDRAVHFCGKETPRFGVPYCRDCMRRAYTKATRAAMSALGWPQPKKPAQLRRVS